MSWEDAVRPPLEKTTSERGLGTRSRRHRFDTFLRKSVSDRHVLKASPPAVVMVPTQCVPSFSPTIKEENKSKIEPSSSKPHDENKSPKEAPEKKIAPDGDKRADTSAWEPFAWDPFDSSSNPQESAVNIKPPSPHHDIFRPATTHDFNHGFHKTRSSSSRTALTEFSSSSSSVSNGHMGGFLPPSPKVKQSGLLHDIFVSHSPWESIGAGTDVDGFPTTPPTTVTKRPVDGAVFGSTTETKKSVDEDTFGLKPMTTQQDGFPKTQLLTPTLDTKKQADDDVFGSKSFPAQQDGFPTTHSTATMKQADEELFGSFAAQQDGFPTGHLTPTTEPNGEDGFGSKLFAPPEEHPQWEPVDAHDVSQSQYHLSSPLPELNHHDDVVWTKAETKKPASSKRYFKTSSCAFPGRECNQEYDSQTSPDQRTLASTLKSLPKRLLCRSRDDVVDDPLPSYGCAKFFIDNDTSDEYVQVPSTKHDVEVINLSRSRKRSSSSSQDQQDDLSMQWLPNPLLFKWTDTKLDSMAHDDDALSVQWLPSRLMCTWNEE